MRIIHGLDRFSEDLDFSLIAADLEFDLSPYLVSTSKIMQTYGYSIAISGKDNDNSNVKMRFLKDDSIKSMLNFSHHSDKKKKIKIKVEIDVNPPRGGVAVPGFVDFPMDFAVNAHDLSTLAAGKCHALLCREYAKGRDWYDFSWYCSRGVKVNHVFLSEALNQVGPWRNKGIKSDDDWLKEQLLLRAKELDWTAAISDVRRFLRPDKIEVLDLWGKDFFTQKIGKLFR